MNEIKYKVCSHCKEEKPVSEFSKDKTRKDGLYSQCKSCVKVYQATLKHRVHIEIENKVCAKCGAEKPVNRFSKDRHTKDGLQCWCKECRKEHQKAYIQTDRGKEVSRIAAHKRRAKKKEVEHLGMFAPEQLAECRAYFNDCCAYSGEPLNGGGEIEHIVPISKGGSNNINNIVLASKSVNCSKNANEDWVSWYREQTYYKKSRENKIKKWIKMTSQVSLLDII